MSNFINCINKDVCRLIITEVLSQVAAEHYQEPAMEHYYFLARAEFSPMTQEILRLSRVCRLFRRVLREITRWGNGNHQQGNHFYRIR
uniref:Uncharacterized protein n=1 Tax=viral metagenome TaxID=1070528 RepID=A0A6C0BMN6_9ZZZZ